MDLDNQVGFIALTEGRKRKMIVRDDYEREKKQARVMGQE